MSVGHCWSLLIEQSMTASRLDQRHNPLWGLDTEHLEQPGVHRFTCFAPPLTTAWKELIFSSLFGLPLENPSRRWEGWSSKTTKILSSFLTEEIAEHAHVNRPVNRCMFVSALLKYTLWRLSGTRRHWSRLAAGHISLVNSPMSRRIKMHTPSYSMKIICFHIHFPYSSHDAHQHVLLLEPTDTRI